jgi:N-acyl-D-aspartate/D-glutamate deacylase
MVLLLVSAACSPADRSADPLANGPYDLWIAGGTVVDGTGEPGVLADILVRDGRIEFVGPLGPEAAAAIEASERFDAAGLVVAPGFIDAHAHGAPLEDPAFHNFLAMGVTTVVLGQDGGSPEATAFASHLDTVDAARPGVNVAYLVGHGTVRTESGVGFSDPGPEGLERMAGLVEVGLHAGAFGLSTGLEYDLGSRADLSELTAIAVPVAAHDAVVVSHMRTEDADRVDAALDELIEQGRQSGARVQASHLKIVLESDPAQATALLERMDAARSEGVAVTADVYPYTASYTGIGILFPEWARAPNDYEAVVRERRVELAGHLRRRVESRNGPDATLFGSGEYAGRTLAEVAAEQGRPFEEVLIELGPEGASAAYFVMDAGVVRALLADAHTVVSSDGSPSMLHPRGYGSFARVIRHFVVEDGVLSIEEAVRKMTGQTARNYRMDDPAVVDVPRGQVREGWAADLVAFDPAEVRDVAAFDDPHQLAEGMQAVWVGGEFALRYGTPLPGPGHGVALRARR